MSRVGVQPAHICGPRLEIDVRQLQGIERKLADWLAIAFALFFMYAITTTVPFYITSPLYICFCYVLIFFLYPARSGNSTNRLSVVDWLLCLLTILTTAFFFNESSFYIDKPGLMRPQDIVISTLALLLSMEACRRVLGWSLPLLALLSLAYVLWGQIIPGALGHRGYPFERAAGQIFGFDGIYGSVTSIYSTYVLMFVIFGAVVQACGLGDFLLRLSTALVGRLTGGTAKTAIVSSGAVGMIIGSGAANVAVTGSFTIPLMKRKGYPAHIAGAIETVASAGGVLMPPIMGSVAFLLASFTAIPYRDVALYSFAPALLFYWGTYIQVHFLSHRMGIPHEDAVESGWTVIRQGGHMMLPVLLVFFLIFYGSTPYRAGLWAIAATILMHYMMPLGRSRMGVRELLEMFGEGARLQLTVGASAGVIGIIMAMLVLPGLPLKVASFAVELSQGSLFILMLLMIIVSYIFGMGIPAVAAYIILAVIAVPALVQVGLPLFNAHLIIMWFTLSALWTPPVAVGAFIASGIAGANASKIGWYSVRLGAGLYIIPFLMAYGTIVSGTWLEIIYASIAIAVSLYCFAAVIEGHTRRPLLVTERVMLCGIGIITLWPDPIARAVGLAIFAVIMAFEHRTALFARVSSQSGE